jgi:exopolysaccharide production protein ExoZ
VSKAIRERQNLKRLGNVELLRAIAASWVVLTHASGWVTAQGIAHFGSSFFSFGFVGVDIFFAISGFVITLSYMSRPVSFVKFMWARVLRIVPLYWTVTLLTALVAVVYLASGARSDAFSAMSPGWVFASMAFVSQSLFGISPVVYQGWTLELEMAFYLLFGAAIYLSKGRKALIFSILTLALVFVCGLQWLPTIVLEFCFGILVALFLTRAPKTTKGTLAIAVLASSLGLIGLWISLTGGFAEEWRFAALGIPSALVLLAAVMFPQVDSAWINSIGSASYGIYLWQVLAIPISAPLALMLFGDQLPTTLVLVPLLTTMLVGVVSDRYFDQPVRAWLKKKVPIGQELREHRND